MEIDITNIKVLLIVNSIIKLYSVRNVSFVMKLLPMEVKSLMKNENNKFCFSRQVLRRLTKNFASNILRVHFAKRNSMQKVNFTILMQRLFVKNVLENYRRIFENRFKSKINSNENQNYDKRAFRKEKHFVSFTLQFRID